jgi:hypothetical protein
LRTRRFATSQGPCPARFVCANDAKKAFFIDKPFQNWTRENADLIAVVYFYLDDRAPVGVIREKLKAFVEQSKFWNGNVVSVQLTGAKETTMEVRAIMSADDASRTWNLRCEVREKMIDFLQREHPGGATAPAPPPMIVPGCLLPSGAAIVPTN